MQQGTESIVAIRGGSIELACKTYGKQSGEPLVLIHGLGAQGVIQWPPALIDILVEGGFFVVTFDNRDCGQSTFLQGDQ